MSRRKNLGPFLSTWYGPTFGCACGGAAGLKDPEWGGSIFLVMGAGLFLAALVPPWRGGGRGVVWLAGPEGFEPPPPPHIEEKRL